MRIFIIAAYKQEVQYFIMKDKLLLEEKNPFAVFRGDKYSMIISGQGKVHAAAAITYIYRNFDFDYVLNIGSAGAVKPEIKEGMLFGISGIFEPDRPLFNGEKRFLRNENKTGLPGAVCLCRDNPVVTESERAFFSEEADIADMESSGILQVCRLLKLQCSFIKIVSDGTECTDKKEIIEKMSGNSRKLYTTVNDFMKSIKN